MRYKYILMDLDGTILDSKKLERYALKSTFEELSLIFTEEIIDTYHHINIKYWSLYEASLISQGELRRRRFADLFEIFNITGVDPMEINRLFISHSCSYIPMYEGTVEVLQKLSATQRLFMVTNGFTATQKKKIECAGIGHFFEKIFIAEEMGAKKPEKEYFERVYSAIERPAKEEIIIVGDSLMADIMGGADFGINTCWFNPGGNANETEIVPTVEIDRLDKVLLL